MNDHNTEVEKSKELYSSTYKKQTKKAIYFLLSVGGI